MGGPEGGGAVYIQVIDRWKAFANNTFNFTQYLFVSGQQHVDTCGGGGWGWGSGTGGGGREGHWGGGGGACISVVLLPYETK